jgi:hypothetical protein
MTSGHVRFGSLVDIKARRCDVRFTPESGHVRRNYGCPLSGNSGHDSQPDLPHLRAITLRSA